MTPFQWALTIVGIVAWLAAGLAIAWSIYALATNHTTTSQFLSGLPTPLVALTSLVLGLIVGFVCGHWWW